MSIHKRMRIDSRTLVYGELKQSGGDPSTLFEILEGVIERHDWEFLVDDEGKPVGSFRRFLEAPLPVGCGVKAEKILALLRVEHRYETDKDYAQRMKNLRDHVADLLKKAPSNDDSIMSRDRVKTKRFTVSNYDMDVASKVLARNLNKDQIEELVKRLSEFVSDKSNART